MRPAGILFALALTCSAQDWKPLFDGRSFDGWLNPAHFNPPGDAWTIEDGCLKARARPRITEELFTREAFRDLELVFDWRIAPGGNSGVKYRIQDHLFVRAASGLKRFEDQVAFSYRNRVQQRPDRGQDYVIGFEYQVIDNARAADARTGALHSAGALYDMAPAAKDASRPAGEWNQSRLRVKGNHVEHWLNGQKVVEADLDSPEVKQHIARRWGTESPVYHLLAEQPKKDCPISLQNHGADCWFRNIKVRRLD